MSGPPEYDPRRLFPFGLSPIPEVPSELASEVSSMYSYAPEDDEESEAETEVEGTKTPGSIMYSGSCSSVKSNGTLEDKAQAVGSSSGAESSDEEEDTEEEETDDEGDKVIIEAKPIDVHQDGSLDQHSRGDEGIDESLENEDEEEEEEEESEEESESTEDSDSDEDTGNHYNSCVTAVTHQTRSIRAIEEQKEETTDSEPMLAIVPSASSSNLDPSPGAICATEIFQHLQATRGKEEVTTELAKILNVLQTTLKEDSSSSSESESSDESKEASPEPSKTPPKPPPLGKPPVHPLSLKGINQRKVAPEIQRKIKELASLKPEKGKEEMSILSKILVTLLCSCKSAEATSELRKIIRHFKEAASEACDEVDEEIRPIKSRSGRTASRGSKRRQRSRSRRSSANSNNSNSEAESLTNTLTPCNTDSKSSGTEDECPVTVPPQRCSVCHTPTNDTSKEPEEEVEETVQPDVSFTVSLPRRPSIEVAEITASISPTKMLQQNSNHQENDEEEEEEWEWEEDDDAASGRSRRSGKRVDSISSRDLSSAELKQDNSTTSSTRKILTEMECGAYNSDSLCSPGHNSGQSDGVSMSEQSHESPALDGESELEDEEEEESEEEEEENLYSHLEETYRVLNGAYQIITAGAHSETIVKEEVSSTITTTVQEEVASTIIQEEAVTVPKAVRMLSRPSSKMSRPSSRRSRAHSENGTEDDDWGDDEEGDWEWEYYYEEEDGEEPGQQPVQVKKSPEKSPEKPIEIPVIHEPPPIAHQRYFYL